MRSGLEWDEASREAWWTAYYAWLEPRLFQPGRWAIMPDSPGAPTQWNDGLLNDWPHGTAKGAPVWHMNQSIDRLARLLDRYPRVCIGWVGRPKAEPVGCPAFHDRMAEVEEWLDKQGGTPEIHLLRGTLVAQQYPHISSADSTSLAQNGHRYDSALDELTGDRWRGRRAYADRLESGRFRKGLFGDRRNKERARGAQGARLADQRGAAQLGLWAGD